jgi:hypothetical protein
MSLMKQLKIANLDWRKPMQWHLLKDTEVQITLKLPKSLIHNPTTDNIEEKMNLLQKREDVERALMEYQRSYLSSEIFHEIKVAMSVLPSTTI